MIRKNIAVKYQALQSDFEKRMESGKLGNLSLSNFQSVAKIGKELLIKHVSSTFIKNVAEYFKSFGFMVTMDFDNVNYVIVEA